MLALNTLRDVPDELANRMMVAHGSRELLRAINGEPPENPEPACESIRYPTTPGRHVRVSDRPQVPIPEAVQGILDAVASAFATNTEALRGRGRHNYLILARAVACRLIRDRTWPDGEPRNSMTRIGNYLNRDHSTIGYSLDHFDDYCRYYPRVREVYDRLRERAE